MSTHDGVPAAYDLRSGIVPLLFGHHVEVQGACHRGQVLTRRGGGVNRSGADGSANILSERGNAMSGMDRTEGTPQPSSNAPAARISAADRERVIAVLRS